MGSNLGPAGTYTITMDRGYAYSLVAESVSGAGHLHNTRIRTTDPNKRIVVSTTDESVHWSGMDLIGDQLVPIELLGDRYIAIKNYCPGNDNGIFLEQVFVFPTEDNTVVTIGDQTYPPMNIGDKIYADLVDDATLISSADGKPIMVFQVSGYNDSPVTEEDDLEPGGALLPRLDCTGSIEVAFRTAITNTKENPHPSFHIVTKKEYIDAFTLNGDPSVITSTMFKAVPGTNDEYYWCTYETPDRTFDVIRIKNTKGGLFQLGVRDPYSSSNALAYFSDFYYATLKPRLNDNYYIEGDTLHLFLHDAGAFEDITWIGPDGTVYPDDGSGITIYPVTEDNIGVYRVGAEMKDRCNDLDTAYVGVTVFTKEQITDTISMCDSWTETLTADGYAPYVWILDGDTLSTDKEISVSPDSTSVYQSVNRKMGVSVPFNGDFQRQDIDFLSDYTRVSPVADALDKPGTFVVWRNAKDVNSNLGRVYDHTESVANRSQDGRYLISNTTAGAGHQIWTKTVDVDINTRYELSGWFITPLRNGDQARLQIFINDVLVTDLLDENGDFYQGEQDSVIIPRNDMSGTSPDHWGKVTGVWESDLYTTAVISIRTADGNVEGACVGIDDLQFMPLYAVTDTVHVRVNASPEFELTSDSDILCGGQAVLTATAGANDTVPYELVNWFLQGSDEPLAEGLQYTATAAGDYVLEVMNENGCTSRDTISVGPGVTIEVNVEGMPDACAGDAFYVIDYDMAGEQVGAFNITYDSVALAAGFVNLANQVATDGLLQVPLPASVQPGIYNAELEVFGNDACAGSQKSAVQVSVRYAPESLLAQKWNDVLAVFNEDYAPGHMKFVEFQWYKDGELLEGETKSYLYVQDGTLDPEAAYSVRLTQEDGTVFYTCDYYPELRSESVALPTMVAPGQSISLDAFEPGQATFYDVKGLFYSRTSFSSQSPAVIAPLERGFYVLDINSSGEQKQFKMFVK